MTVFRALAAVLDELARAIGPLTPTEFSLRPRATSGSIGGHVRHCLDHVDALERALQDGRCCYDHRQRGTPVEHDPGAALARLTACRARLERVHDAVLARSLDLEVCVSATGTVVRTRTTVAREAAYVISHTVHHAALIGVLLEDQGLAVPNRLGVAPTTPDLHAPSELPCAR